ncbi:MAG: DUF4149 domain-containing protein [Candidatus Binatia bacterium]
MANLDQNPGGNTFAKSLFLFGLVGWVGSAWFFSLLVLPQLFANLDRPEAGRVAALLFPSYYWLGLIAGLLVLVASLMLATRARTSFAWKLATATVAMMFVCQAWATLVLQPRAAAMRGKPEYRQNFARVHHRAVLLNGFVVSGGTVLVLCGGLLLAKH